MEATLRTAHDTGSRFEEPEQDEAVDRFIHGIAHLIDAFGPEQALVEAARIVVTLQDADIEELIRDG